MFHYTKIPTRNNSTSRHTRRSSNTNRSVTDNTNNNNNFTVNFENRHFSFNLSTPAPNLGNAVGQAISALIVNGIRNIGR